MPALFLSLILAASPVDFGPTDRVDLVETNAYYDADGRPLLTQLLFMDWNAKEARYEIREWRLAKNTAMHPQEMQDGTYRVTWREGGEPRTVYATRHRVTYTQFDPELIQRRQLPREERIPLFPERQPTPAVPPIVRTIVEAIQGNDPLPPAP